MECRQKDAKTKSLRGAICAERGNEDKEGEKKTVKKLAMNES